MDANAIGTVDEAAIQPPSPPPAPRIAEEETPAEPEQQTPEPADDTGKRLDLYA